jgi:hypothetical protein
VIIAGRPGMVHGKDGSNIARRNIVLADETSSSVLVGLWGDDAC